MLVGEGNGQGRNTAQLNGRRRMKSEDYKSTRTRRMMDESRRQVQYSGEGVAPGMIVIDLTQPKAGQGHL